MVLPQKIRLLAIAGLLLSVLVWAPVNAQTTDDESEETTTTTTTTREERLAERKAALQTRLTNAQQTRLRGRCRAAQVILGAYGERLVRLDEKRTEAHTKIITKLNDIVTQTGDQADTTDLKTSITTLQGMIDEFADKLDDYQVAVEDLAKMECTDDPTAFQATLETIRTQRKDLLESAKAIRKYILETIKPQLQDLRTALRGESDESESESETAE